MSSMELSKASMTPLATSPENGAAQKALDAYPRVIGNNPATPRIEIPMANYVRTTKYTVVTFIPLSLFAQFKRVANIYFLVIAVLQGIPQISPLNPITAILPLVFVTGLSMFRDALEDYYRYKSDKCNAVLHSCNCGLAVNEREAQVFQTRTKTWIQLQWQHIQAGDLVLLHDKSDIPADSIVLSSSSSDGSAHVDTMNLDGETNLKKKVCHPTTIRYCQIGFGDVSKILTELHVRAEHPKLDLYSFNGLCYINDEREVLFDASQLLLRGSKIRNTKDVVAMCMYVGHETREMLNSKNAPQKQSNLEKIVNKIIIAIFLIQVLLALIAAIIGGEWVANYGADASYLDCYSYYDCNAAAVGTLQFLTYIVLLNTLIPISLVVTMEIVKVIQSYFIQNDEEMMHEKEAHGETIKAGAIARSVTLTEELGQIKYIFSDKTGTLTQNKMEFGMVTVAGIIYGADSIFVSQGHAIPEVETEAKESKADGAAAGHKRGMTEKMRQHSMSAIADLPALDIAKNLQNLTMAAGRKVMGPEDIFLTMLTICNGILAEKSDKGVVSFNSDSPDEIALVQGAIQAGYVFIDRRGNIIDMTINGQLVNYEILQVIPFTSERKRMTVLARRLPTQDEKNAMQCLPVKSDVQSNLGSQFNQYNDVKYDVYCFTKGADNIIMDRCSDRWLSMKAGELNDSLREYEGIRIDSRRGQFSGRDDETPPSRLSAKSLSSRPESKSEASSRMSMRDLTLKHLSEFSKTGLRTLCFAFRPMDTKFYESWATRYRNAQTKSPEERERDYVGLAEDIERDLILVGSTAIEDKLQDSVPETIHRLKRAGINLWVLTGDKQETAIEIGRSCRLLDGNMALHILNAASVEALTSVLGQELSSARSSTSKQTTHGLVVDGKTLLQIVQSDENEQVVTTSCTSGFLELADICSSVIVCRCSPLQKALVVELMKLHKPGLITLAVGDGANDVSMIRSAAIGIGIAGQEGMQAVRSSDFAVQQFQDMDRLLLFHGRLSYVRLARMINYFFYKNFMFTLPLWFFGSYCVYSGQTFYDDVYITLYNVIFTVLPVFFFATMEQDVEEAKAICVPELYIATQSNLYFKPHVIGYWIVLATLTSVLFFSAPIAALPLDVNDPEGLWMASVASFTLVILGVTLKICLITRNWNWVITSIYAFSIILYFIIIVGYDSYATQIQNAASQVLNSDEFWLLAFWTMTFLVMAHYLIEGSWENYAPKRYQDPVHALRRLDLDKLIADMREKEEDVPKYALVRQAELAEEKKKHEVWKETSTMGKWYSQGLDLWDSLFSGRRRIPSMSIGVPDKAEAKA